MTDVRTSSATITRLATLAAGCFLAAVGFFGTAAFADAAAPTMTAVVSDADANGTVDKVVITFSEASDVKDTGAETDGLDSLSINNGCTIPNGNYARDGATTLTITGLTGCTAGNTGITPTVAYTSVANCATTFAICDDALANQMANATNDVSADEAKPVISAVELSSASGLNRVSFTFTEPVVASNGASSTTKGDLTAAGVFASFCTFSTTGNVTVATTKNTVAGSGTPTITVDVAAQAAGFMASTSTTAPSGTCSPNGAHADVADAQGNQVNQSGAAITATGTGTWDVTKPTISSVTLADAVGNNGKVDRATVVFSEAIRDANVTDADGLLGGAAGTFTTGTANDATTAFNKTADNLSVDTSASAAQFTYTAATTSITDSAGNLVNTATDGVIVDGDTTEVDGASPILVSIALATASNRNRMTFTYSEAMTITNGASTATKGDVTAAGTVAGFGSFAVAGDASVATLKNTVAGSGTAAITIDLADQTGGSFTSASSTEPSGVFTPVGSAELVDAVSLQVNTSATPTASTSGWDLTKPTITSVTISDSAGSNGRVDRAVLVFDTAVRDSSITDGDALLGGVTHTGTFTTGTANDESTTFNLTSDTLAQDTSTTTGDFTYTAGTTRITDLVGNRLDTATDGVIVTADIAETDAAVPVPITATFYDATSNDGKLDKIIVIWSENITARADASLVWAVSSAANFSTLAEGTVLCNSGAAAANACNYNFTTATVKTSVGDLTLTYTSGGVATVTDGTNPAATVALTATASAGSPAFTDAAAPVVASSTPALNATAVLRSSTISLVFSEVIASLTTSITGGVTLTNGGLSSATVVLSGTKIAGTNVLTVATAPDAAGNAFNRFLESGAATLTFQVASTNSNGTTSTSSTPATYGVAFTAPVAAAEYNAGDSIDMTWTNSGTGSAAAADIFYSTDGGITWNTIVEDTTNDTTYTWIAPDITATSVTLKINTTDLLTTLATDQSDAFSISGTSTSTDSSDTTDTTDTSSGSTTLLPTGTFFKGESWSTVYYVDGTTRRPFLDSQTFFTYVDNFDSVIDAADDYLANYTIGAPMLPKAGTVLVKIQSVAKVYVLGEDSELRWITSEALAISLYGSAWADYVIDVPVTAWSHFTIGEDIDAASDITVDSSLLQTRNALNSK